MGMCCKKGQASDEKEFKASKCWLNSFSNRFNLKNMQLTGDSASANEEAAKAYPEQLKKIIEENGYLPGQVLMQMRLGSSGGGEPTAHSFRNPKDTPLASKQLKTV
jgi:hypothetical protein